MHTVQKSKETKTAKHPLKFLIYGAEMLEKGVAASNFFLQYGLFCKSRLSKMVSTKTNKIKKWTPLLITNFS